MQPGEALILFLDATNTLVLTPGCCDGNGRYSTTVMVESGLPVEFRTSDRADRQGERVGGWVLLLYWVLGSPVATGVGLSTLKHELIAFPPNQTKPIHYILLCPAARVDRTVKTLNPHRPPSQTPTRQSAASGSTGRPKSPAPAALASSNPKK